MFSRGVNYRGSGACQEDTVPTQPASSGLSRGGTKGKGTRQGTKRSHLQQLAFDWDPDGWQLACLQSALAVYLDPVLRARVCAGTGRHAGSLVLHRPRRGSCSSSHCDCDAETRTIADRIGMGTEPHKVHVPARSP
jgi:hypothetical protein